MATGFRRQKASRLHLNRRKRRSKTQETSREPGMHQESAASWECKKRTCDLPWSAYERGDTSKCDAMHPSETACSNQIFVVGSYRFAPKGPITTKAQQDCHEEDHATWNANAAQANRGKTGRTFRQTGTTSHSNWREEAIGESFQPVAVKGEDCVTARQREPSYGKTENLQHVRGLDRTGPQR